MRSGLTEELLLGDLSVFGSLADGGDMGKVDVTLYGAKRRVGLEAFHRLGRRVDRQDVAGETVGLQRAQITIAG